MVSASQHDDPSNEHVIEERIHVTSDFVSQPLPPDTDAAFEEHMFAMRDETERAINLRGVDSDTRYGWNPSTMLPGTAFHRPISWTHASRSTTKDELVLESSHSFNRRQA